MRHIQSFEGIKPPYRAPDVDGVHWFLYLVHLGTRFTRSARNQIIEDMATEDIEVAAYCNPLHLQYYYARYGCAKGDLFVTEKIADRALALPFHGGLDDDQVAFIVATAKDSSINRRRLPRIVLTLIPETRTRDPGPGTCTRIFPKRCSAASPAGR